MSNIILVRNTSRPFPVQEVTKKIFEEENLEVVTFNPQFKDGTPVFSIYRNAGSLPYIQLLKKPAQGNKPARYLDCIVSNGSSRVKIDLYDIGAVPGVCQTDREVLRELMETAISIMQTSCVTKPSVDNGFKIEALTDNYYSF